MRKIKVTFLLDVLSGSKIIFVSVTFGSEEVKVLIEAMSSECPKASHTLAPRAHTLSYEFFISSLLWKTSLLISPSYNEKNIVEIRIIIKK